MYNKVVVPLDGSNLAEVALPHVEEMAHGCNITEILLISVTEPLKGINIDGGLREYMGNGEYGMDGGAPVLLGRMAKTALNYLEKMANQLQKKGLTASYEVLMGDPAEQILSFADQKGADLIVMASRGKSNNNRWDMGNVADKVTRASTIPVLLVKPEPGFKETKPKRRGKAA